MNNPTKKDIMKWVNALRSGKYRQSTLRLQNDKGFCCLGVACDIFIPKSKQTLYDGFLIGKTPSEQKYAPKWLKDINDTFFIPSMGSLTKLNDFGHPKENLEEFTFNEIADLLQLVYIEKMETK